MNLTVNQLNHALIKEEIYNNLMQKWLSDDYILMYSTYNKDKSVVVERFTRMLKGEIYKKIAANESNY